MLANMGKAELFGVESIGVILAVGEEDNLLAAYGNVEVGERVR